MPRSSFRKVRTPENDTTLSAKYVCAASISCWLAPKCFKILVRCIFMCPFCMPLVVRARRAAKFCDKPVAAIIIMSSEADGLPSSSRLRFASGCKEVKPPTVPTASGKSIQNLKKPSFTSQYVSEE